MNMLTPRERVLGKIRKALVNTTPKPFPDEEPDYPVFNQNTGNLTALFESEFTGLLGVFTLCKDDAELRSQLAKLISEQGWKNLYLAPQLSASFNGLLLENDSSSDMENTDVAITDCECLVARTGSAVLSSAQTHGRAISVYAPVHVIIAYTSQIVNDIENAFQFIKNKYPGKLPSCLTVNSGPSRTGDIEKTLIVGVHGPKQVYVFLIDDIK